MARIALRAYIREITDLIDNRQIDEAISHCRHILEQYPKHVDTYRLLGKAYLEEQRYSDAADILQRVLSSVPDDFISHIGMSIIREDEGNLDAAIYHMEMAFETQPSNHPIQNELRRLHGVRGGIEPARIRLTRGALSRMYAHGHLYDQAIAELQAAISEDTQRLDLWTLLAEMYYRADKKVDAAESCTKILEKLPYCLSATQLLSKILTENGRTAEADRYKMRWESLDPYAQFVDDEYPTIDDVPEESITVERHEWEPESSFGGEGSQPAWASSLGMTIEEEEEQERDSSIPTWLSEEDEEEIGEDVSPDEAVTTEFDLDALSESSEDDWPDQEEEQDELSLFEIDSPPPKGEDDFFASLEEDAIEEEPLPDLLRDDDKTEDKEKEDWLTSFGEPEEEPAQPLEEETEDSDDWFATFGEITDEPAEGNTAPTAVSADLDEDEQDEDDWLASLGETAETEAPSLEPVEEGDDDWLSGLESAESDTAPTAVSADSDEDEQEEDDWLASLGETAETEAPSLEPLEEGDDDWLSALESAESDTAPTAVSADTDEDEQDEDDWLASLGESAETETPSLEPLEEGDDDWLSALESAESDTAPTAVSADSDQDEQDDEDDWLASLEETTEEETPEETIEEKPEIPEFLREAGWEERSGDEEDFKPVEYLEEESEEESEEDEIEQGELPPWLQGLAPEETEPKPPTSDLMGDLDPEWVAEADSKSIETPDWLTELDEEDQAEESVSEESVESEEPAQGLEIEPDDMDMAWLESLAAKQGIPDEELVTTPEQRSQVEEGHVPEDKTAEEELATSIEPLQEEAEEEKEDDWLAGLGEETAETDEDDDWLAGLGEEVVTTEPDETLSLVIDEKAEEEDELDTDWLDQIGKEAAEEAAATSIEPIQEKAEEEKEDDWLAGLGEETAETDEEDDWLAGLGEEVETTEPDETLSLVIDEEEEEEDELDTDWLDQIGKEAAEEAAATAVEPSSEEPAESDQPDWLSGLTEEEETAEPAPESAVLEEEDDFDMDWLDEIGKEAAEEAAPTAVEPPTEEPAESDQTDWLSGLTEEEETAEPAPESAVLEEEDDFDMDWLDEIGKEAAEEAAATAVEPPTEKPAESDQPDWLAGLTEDQAEAEDDDWLSGLTSTSEESQAEEEIQETSPFQEELQEAEEESDALNTDWLQQIGQEAAQEAAETSIEPPVEPGEEAEEEPIDEETASWLASVEQETVSDQIVTTEDTIGRFISDLDADQPDEEEVPPAPAADDDFDMDWLEEISQEDADSEIEASAEEIESVEEEDPLLPELTEEEPADQDVDGAEEAAEEILPEQPAEYRPGVSPTQASEWVPEFQDEEGTSAEPEPAPPAEAEAEAAPQPDAEQVAEPAVQLDPNSPEGILENARTLMEEGHLEASIAAYNKLIKKGKMVGTVIEEIQAAIQRHPVEYNLWQTLGDAYLRMDNLQEAMDAYTKAEELLR